MICPYCRYPMSLPAPPEADKAAQFEQTVQCRYCQAVMDVLVTVTKRPQMSEKRLSEIRNVPSK